MCADPARDHDGLVVAVRPSVAAPPGVDRPTAFIVAVGRPLLTVSPHVVAGAPADIPAGGATAARHVAVRGACARFVRTQPRGVELDGAKEPAEARTSELVVECGGADRPFKHDLEGGCNVRGPAQVVLPRLDEAGNAQIRHRESGDACLASSTATGRRLVADFAAGAGGGARKGRNRRRMVVRLHLHHDVHPAGTGRVATGMRVRDEPARIVPSHDGCIVAIRRQHVAGMSRVGMADHREQRPVALDAVDRPRRVEYLVAAMLGIHLSEHHHLGVARVAAKLRKPRAEVFHLVGVQPESECGIDVAERAGGIGVKCDRRVGYGNTALEEDVDGLTRAGGPPFGVHATRGAGAVGALRHSVMEKSGLGDRSQRVGPLRAGMRDGPYGSPLNAHDRFEAAVSGDVGRTARPRRNRARTRRHDDGAVEHRVCPFGLDVRGVEKLSEPLENPGSGVTGASEVHPASVDGGNRRHEGACALDEPLAAECRKGNASPEQQGGDRRRGRGVHLGRANDTRHCPHTRRAAALARCECRSAADRDQPLAAEGRDASVIASVQGRRHGTGPRRTRGPRLREGSRTVSRRRIVSRIRCVVVPAPVGKEIER